MIKIVLLDILLKPTREKAQQVHAIKYDPSASVFSPQQIIMAGIALMTRWE